MISCESNGQNNHGDQSAYLLLVRIIHMPVAITQMSKANIHAGAITICAVRVGPSGCPTVTEGLVRHCVDMGERTT